LSVAPSDPAADDWDDHWDAYSEAAAGNPAQEYRRRLALGLLERGGRPVRLVDVGSGQGDFLAAAARRWPQAELLGLEVSERGISEAQTKVPRAAFLLRDLLAEGNGPDRFDHWATHALCSEVLEHVDRPDHLLRNARAYLAPGARLVVTVPGGRMSAFDQHIGHRRHYTPAELGALLSSAGFEVELVAGAGFPFFNLYRALVIARGKRLVDDVASSGDAAPSIAARAAMAAFRPLFRLTLPRSRWGRQIIGVARAPAAAPG
jgi:SAM-dependent methyltransferase